MVSFLSVILAVVTFAAVAEQSFVEDPPVGPCFVAVPATVPASHSNINVSTLTKLGSVLYADDVLHAARLADLCSKSGRCSSIVVLLHPGVHYLSSTLELHGSSSRPLHAVVPVLWTSATAYLSGHASGNASGNASAVPDAVLAGGAPLANWQSCAQSTGGMPPCSGWRGTWAHRWPPSGAAAGPVRVFWVNSTRVPRATTPSSALPPMRVTSTGFNTTNGAALPAASRWPAAEVELRWPRQIRNWIQPRCVVSGVSSAGSFDVASGCWAELKKRANTANVAVPLWFDNVPGLQPPAGTFTAVGGWIFYTPAHPHPHVAPSGAVAPTMQTLVNMSSLRGYTWSHVSFRYTSWRGPSSPGGYVPTQSAVSNQGEPPGAVTVAASSGIFFVSCSFENMGAAYALSVGMGSKNVLIERCVFEDVSGGAVKVANVGDPGARPADWNENYTVVNCVVNSTAVEFAGASALFAGYLRNVTIAHNNVSHTGYTGISLGWGWGKKSYAGSNTVAYNSLHSIMETLNDGGCIYTLGPQPNSVVHHNHCKVDDAPVVGCFYHDNGSSGFVTTYNVAERSPAPCVYLQGCCGAPAYNVTVDHLWCHGTAPPRNDCAPEGCHVFHNVTVPVNSPLPAEAQSIVNQAGARV